MLKKKKVLLFIDRWASGGIESFIVTLLENADRSLYDFTIITSTKESHLFDQRLDALNIHFVTLLHHYQPWYIRPFIMIRKFKKFIRCNTFDIYHFNIYNALSLIFPFLVGKNSKIIIHSHNADVAHDKTRYVKLTIHNLARSLFLRKKYNLVAVSNLAGKWMFKNNSFILVNNGINTKKFKYSDEVRKKYRQIFNIEESSIVLLNIGRLNEQKNQSYFIDIVNILKEKYLIDVKAIIIGDGPLLRNLNEKISSLSLEKIVRILPSRNDVENIASMADIFILPSVYEGLPLAGVEMQSSGLKCLFSEKIDRDVKIIEQSGFINIDYNFEKCVDTIIDSGGLLTSADRLNANKIVKEKGFDILDTVNNLMSIYEN